MFNLGLKLSLNVLKPASVTFHADYKLLYLLEGGLSVLVGDEEIHLKQNDLLLINAGEPHGYTVETPGRMLTLFIDASVFDDLIGKGVHLFDLNSTDELTNDKKQAGFATVRKHTNLLLYGYLENGSRIGILEYQVYFRLLNSLVNVFLVPSENLRVLGRNVEMNSRTYDVIRFVQANYGEQITLAGLAKQLYVSEAHLSRELKRSLGISFRDYLNQVRLGHAVEEFLHTEKSTARIAFDNGFSSIAMLNKTFADTHGITPSAYRKNGRELMESELKHRRELEEKTAMELKVLIFGTGEKRQDNRTRSVTADISRFVPYKKIWTGVINAGNAFDLLNPKIQEHILLLNKELDIQSVRFWGVWDREMMIFPHDSLDNLNFSKLDDCLGFLLANNIKPFLQLGPIATRTIGNEAYSSVAHRFDTPVLKFGADKWGSLIEILIKHLIARFGAQEIESWVFEMWSPGPWDLDWYKWYTEEHYTAFYHAVKKYVKPAMVGGCEFFQAEQTGKIKTSAAYWKRNNAVPDFLSYSGFPYEKWDGEKMHWLTAPDFLSGNVQNIRQDMTDCGLDGIPLYITNWNITMSNRNLFNDTVFKGAYIIKNVINVIGSADLLAYFVVSDAYSEYYDSSCLLYGGCGLISKDGIAKPAMYAFLFLTKLCDNLIAKGENYIITRDAHGRITIVYHNMKEFNYLLNRRELTYENLNIFFSDMEPLNMQIDLANMPDGEYKVRCQSVHAESGSLLDEWLHFGVGTELGPEELRYLSRIVTPRITVKKQSVADGCLKLKLNIRANEFGVIEILS